MDTGSHIQTAKPTSMTLGSFFAGIYTWMFYGLVVSAFTSFIAIQSGLLLTLSQSPVLFYGIAGIELVIVIAAQMLINKLPVELSRGIFFLYAALNGITLSWIFVSYSSASILGVFLIAAGIFGSLAIIGYTTKKDLSSLGPILTVGVFGVLASSILNIFLQNSMLDIIVSAIAIILFCALTVYDNQAYKAMYHQTAHDENGLKKYATLGALHMYINFIMIFVNLLKFFGSSDD